MKVKFDRVLTECNLPRHGEEVHLIVKGRIDHTASIHHGGDTTPAYALIGVLQKDAGGGNDKQTLQKMQVALGAIEDELYQRIAAAVEPLTAELLGLHTVKRLLAAMVPIAK